jgi:hypothetical protein
VNVLWYVLIHSGHIHSGPVDTRASLQEEAAHLYVVSKYSGRTGISKNGILVRVEGRWESSK